MAKKNELVVFDLTVNVDQTKQRLGSLTQEIFKLKEETKKLKAEQKAAFDAKDADALNKVSQAIANNEAKLKTLNTQQRQQQSTLTKVDQANVAAKGSYEQLLRQYELAAVQLKLQEGLLKTNKDGTVVLTDEYLKASQKVKAAKDAIDSFNKGIGDGRSSVGQYAEAIKEAFADSGLFSAQIGQFQSLFKAAKGGTDLFKNGINGVGTALKASGIGLFTSALQILVTFFKSSKQGADVLEQALAGLGVVFGALEEIVVSVGKFFVAAFTEPQKVITAVVDYFKSVVVPYFKGVGNIIAGIFTFDFDQVKQGFVGVGEAGQNLVKPYVEAGKAVKDYADKAIKAANDAATLAKAQQDLDDKMRANNLTLTKNGLEIERILALTKDRGKADQERLDLLEAAGKLEQENLALQVETAEEQLRIIKEQNRLKQEQGKLFDEDEDRQLEAEQNLLKVKGDSAVVEARIEARKSKFKQDINKENIQNDLNALNEQLRNAELKGQDSITLRQEIARKQRDVALTEENLTAQARLNIEAKYQNDLLQIQKDFAEKKKQILLQLEDVNNNLIVDARTREITAEAAALARKLDAIKGNSDAELALRQALKEESAVKIAEINRKFDDVAIQDALKSIDQQAQLEANALQNAYKQKENVLRINASKDKTAAATLNDDLLDLQLEQLEKELAALENTFIQKEIIIATQYEKDKQGLQQLLDDKQITETEHQARLDELDKTFQEGRAQRRLEQGILVANAEQQVNDIIAQGKIDTNTKILENEKQSLEIEHEYNNLRAQLATTLLGGIADALSENEKTKKEFGAFIKALGIAEIGINLQRELSAIALAAEASFQNIATGGAYAATVIPIKSAIAIARAGFAARKILAQKFVVGGYTPDDVGAPADSTGHKPVGVVHAGEWVAPPWMVKSGIFAPVIQQLEQHRINKPLLYADGGFTAQYTQSRASNIATPTVSEQFDTYIKKVQIVASAEEITGTQTRTAEIQQNATI